MLAISAQQLLGQRRLRTARVARQVLLSDAARSLFLARALQGFQQAPASFGAQRAVRLFAQVVVEPTRGARKVSALVEGDEAEAVASAAAAGQLVSSSDVSLFGARSRAGEARGVGQKKPRKRRRERRSRRKARAVNKATLPSQPLSAAGSATWAMRSSARANTSLIKSGTSASSPSTRTTNRST